MTLGEFVTLGEFEMYYASRIVFYLLIIVASILGMLAKPNFFPFFLFILLVGISVLNKSYFQYQCYTNKTYFLTSFVLLALMCLITVYILLFAHFSSYYNPAIYVTLGANVLFAHMIIKEYNGRKINIKEIWKDEW